MGGTSSAPEPPRTAVFSQRDLYSLRQVYHFLCLHTTTLTAVALDESQFCSVFSLRPGHSKAYWSALFQAIDKKRDGIIDFDELVEFVGQMKRGDAAQRRLLAFQLLDADWDGVISLTDVQRVQETRDRRTVSSESALAEIQRRNPSESQLIFNLIDSDYDGSVNYADFEKYCRDYGDGFVMQTLRPVESAFDDVTRPTGIVVTPSDVRNTKPHIDWQDHKVEMYGYLCCSPAPPPVFSKQPAF
jgi:Ca2+-binding EF-hand superfamily protein